MALRSVSTGPDLPSARSVRPAGLSDLDALTALEARAHPKSAWSRDAFQAEVLRTDSVIWVMTDDETDEILMAYLVARWTDQDMHILNLVVSPEYRGLGFGLLLVRNLVSEGLRRAGKRIILEVRKSNAAAVNLYQKQGFSISAVRRGFYTDGEDAYFMELSLEKGERIRV